MSPKEWRKLCDTEVRSNVVKLKTAVLNDENFKPVQTVLLRRVTKEDKLHTVHSQRLHALDYMNWSYSCDDWTNTTQMKLTYITSTITKLQLTYTAADGVTKPTQKPVNILANSIIL